MNLAITDCFMNTETDVIYVEISRPIENSDLFKTVAHLQISFHLKSSGPDANTFERMKDLSRIECALEPDADLSVTNSAVLAARVITVLDEKTTADTEIPLCVATDEPIFFEI